MNDRYPIRMVVTALCIVLVGSVGAATFLAFTQTPIPNIISTLATSSMVGVSALLAKTSPSLPADAPAPVEVVNTAEAPVQVEDANPAGVGIF